MGTKYTFDNWWNGDVILEYATIYHHKNETPLLVGWGDFNLEDVTKIKQEQGRIFAENVNTLLKQHSDQFLERYSNSLIKLEYYRREINECESIINGVFHHNKSINLEHWGISLEPCQKIGV